MISRHTSCSLRAQDPSLQDTTQWKSTAVVLCARGLSEAVRLTLTNSSCRYMFVSSHRETSRPSFLYRPKDHPADLDQSGVVYQLPCSNCPASYIGQTRRKLSQYLSEQRRAMVQSDFNAFALAEHAWSEDHPVDWKNMKILARPRDNCTRTIEEAMFIRTTPNVLHRDQGALPVEYDNLISTPTNCTS